MRDSVLTLVEFAEITSQSVGFTMVKLRFGLQISMQILYNIYGFIQFHVYDDIFCVWRDLEY